MATNLFFPPQLDSDALVNNNLGASIWTADNGLALIGNMAPTNSKQNAAVTITNLNALSSAKLLSVQNGPLSSVGAVGGATQEVFSINSSGNVAFGAALQVHVNPVVVVSSASPYSALSTDSFIDVNTSAGVVTVALPATSPSGQIFVVKDVGGDAGTNNITVDVASSGTIDGASSKTISANYGVLRVFSDGTTYWTW